MRNGFVNVKKVQYMDGEARKGEAKDEPAAPAPLGPQGLSGEVRSDSPKLRGSGQRDLVGVLPQGKGARGGPAQKEKNAQGGVLRECMPSGRHSWFRRLSPLSISCRGRVTFSWRKCALGKLKYTSASFSCSDEDRPI